MADRERQRLHLSDPEWRERLSGESYHVLREGGTEPPFTGRYVEHHEDGQYLCAGCEEPLFDSAAKYDGGSGWPSFTHAAGDCIDEHADTRHDMRRVEVRCARCDGHLGHLFPDGPDPTGLRYCINSAALVFLPRK